jgi:hypothetical protein
VEPRQQQEVEHLIRAGITDSDLVQGDENNNGDDVDMNVMVYDALLSELRQRPRVDRTPAQPPGWAKREFLVARSLRVYRTHTTRSTVDSTAALLPRSNR